MPKNTHKIAIAGVATLGAAAIAFTVVPADGQTTTTDSLSSSRVAYSSGQVRDVKASVTDQLAVSSLKVEAIEAKKKAAADAVAAKKKAAATAAAKKKAAAAAKKAAAARKAKAAAASRSVNRPVVKQVVVKSYPNNLDGWIRESLAIMKKKGIPGSYHGLHKNIIRESSGNPKAINDWDINAINGIPSKGLLQVIPPTFKAYHVPGTSWNIYDPIANITAAANYAADRYGTIDNVNSAY
ncbi:transglycosylase SLT domain-containing protein [Streptomyces sp. ID05-47C]|uniref:transglycosylase SLT domain-containing protein n=1 Tax=Streptomyces sp. ID05-47C TaxID=3028665 RepID=UPI0029B1BA8D|nr:transglycosylase SLT domain-containing protein [Streptomyces sp. ID05-47C]MDX3571374.1 transglycosylase SLT domain-containing protein [Streptomyces sp. ID05-47C]